MPPLRIAIIGAGPAGCLLAGILHRAGLDITIFEAETSPNVRSQGGTLDLHPKTGLAALKYAGLHDEFIKLARPAGGSLSVSDKDLRIYFHIPAFLAGKPEIDRVQLRAILLNSIPDKLIRWGHRLEKLAVTEADGKSAQSNLLVFTKGNTETGFDLVVGADGAWSKVRQFLTDQMPVYSGIGGYELSISDASQKIPWASKLVNSGSLFAFSDGRSIMAQQMGDESILVLVWGRREEDWIEKTLRKKEGKQPAPDLAPAPASKQEELLDGYDDWSPSLLDLIRHADTNADADESLSKATTRSLYMLPVDFTWEHRPGITLVGDAAHLMTPFAGEGVNIAFEDAMKLAQAILKTCKKDPHHDQLRPGPKRTLSLDQAVAAFETDMFQRAHRAQKMTVSLMQAMYFAKGAPRATIESWVIARASYDAPPVLRTLFRPLVVAGIYGVFFVTKLFI